MEDKNKEVQLKEEEAEKVSGGIAIAIGARATATIPVARNTEETLGETKAIIREIAEA